MEYGIVKLCGNSADTAEWESRERAWLLSPTVIAENGYLKLGRRGSTRHLRVFRG